MSSEFVTPRWLLELNVYFFDRCQDLYYLNGWNIYYFTICLVLPYECRYKPLKFLVSIKIDSKLRDVGYVASSM